MVRERILTDDPIRQLWTRFGVLESVSGAERFLVRRAAETEVELSEEILAAKARGFAFAVRSAREYFAVAIEGNLTKACLGFYYGLLSLFQALLLADPANDLTLEDVEVFTSYGHGLRAFASGGEFPENEHVIVMSNGFLPKFLAAYEYPLEIADVAVKGGYKSLDEVPPADKGKVVSVKDLIARIPELLSMYVELFDDRPSYLGMQIVGASASARIHFPDAGNAPGLTAEHIRELLGWSKEVEFERDGAGLRTVDQHDVSDLLRDRQRHSTQLAYDSYVVPILGIDDVLVIQFMLLYVLSIWVRYRPALWREINEGSLDRYRALVTNLLIVVERTAPNTVLDRLYGREFLFAPFSYLS
jgi:hypothetical protein